MTGYVVFTCALGIIMIGLLAYSLCCVAAESDSYMLREDDTE